jgi:simple sugar transport system permease protein
MATPTASTGRGGFPFTVTFEKRVEDVPRWLPAATAVGSVIIAFIISGIILKLIGGQPLVVARFFFEATFGSWPVFSDALVKATPLIMVGLACAIAFKMKLWNIGAEGQFYIGAFAASLVPLIPIVPPDSPKVVVITLMIIFGMLGGAIWGFIPGYLKARFQVNEIITTLMLN